MIIIRRLLESLKAARAKCLFIFRMIWGKYRKYKMRTYINTLQKTFKWVDIDRIDLRIA